MRHFTTGTLFQTCRAGGIKNKLLSFYHDLKNFGCGNKIFIQTHNYN